MLEGQDDKSSNITKKKSIGFFWGNLPSRCVCVCVKTIRIVHIFVSTVYLFIFTYIYIQI